MELVFLFRYASYLLYTITTFDKFKRFIPLQDEIFETIKFVAVSPLWNEVLIVHPPKANKLLYIIFVLIRHIHVFTYANTN